MCSKECLYCQPPRDKSDKIRFIDLGSRMQKKDDKLWGYWDLEREQFIIFFETIETKGPHTCLNPNISQDHHN